MQLRDDCSVRERDPTRDRVAWMAGFSGFIVALGFAAATASLDFGTGGCCRSEALTPPEDCVQLQFRLLVCGLATSCLGLRVREASEQCAVEASVSANSEIAVVKPGNYFAR